MVNSVCPGCILTAPDIAIAACRVSHTHTHTHTHTHLLVNVPVPARGGMRSPPTWSGEVRSLHRVYWLEVVLHPGNREAHCGHGTLSLGQT